MSGAIPPIPPPFGASSGNPGSPNANRVDMMPTTTDPINTITTTNVAQSVVDENLPQLLDSREGSHVINVPAFDKEDFTSWKVRFLVFLDGLEPYLLKTLEDRPFVHMSSLSTFENPLPKRQNQWSNAESRLANKDKRLKSIIISCLPNDVMKSDEESVSSKDEGTTRIRAVMAIAEDEPSVRKADARSSQLVDITMKKAHILLSMIDSDDRKHNKVIRIYLENESLKDEIYDLKRFIEKWACSKVTLDQLLSEQILANIVKALGGKGRRKDNNPSKEVLFTKADISTSVSAPMITSDSEDDSDIQEPLPPIPKLTGTHLYQCPGPVVQRPLNKRSGNKGLLSSNQNPLKSGFTKGTNLCKNVYAGIFKKEPGLKVVFGGNSSGDTEGYGSVNYNGIIFTRVAYVNGLNHNLISFSQLCDANFKVLFTKTQETILNQNDKVVLIAPKRRDVYVIDMSSFNKESNTYFLAKASPRNFLSPCTPEQNGIAKRRNRIMIEAAKTMLNSAKLPKQFWGEAVNAAYYTQNRSIIVKKHRKTVYDVFRGRSPDISYFHVFGCPVHIDNHRDHLGKFDEKVDDGFFLGYSPVSKTFKVFNIRRQEMEEIVHVTFSKDDEAISQTSTEGDAISFNENRSFPEDEFIEPRPKYTQCSANIEFFPYVSAYENITLAISPTLQNFHF
nr:hypothetical protein [Tanacetum cinerariifolium]